MELEYEHFETECWWCGKTDEAEGIHMHHPYRRGAEYIDIKVPLCPTCHRLAHEEKKIEILMRKHYEQRESNN